jgi:hypothetical protein
VQVVVSKPEKEKLVIRLNKENKTIREIAKVVHLSFADIGKIIRKADGMKGDTIDIKHKLRNKSHTLQISMCILKLHAHTYLS